MGAVPVLHHLRSGLTWRDGGFPLIVIAIGLALYLADGYQIVPGGAPRWAHLIGFAVASLALVLLRRERPLLALAVGVLMTGVDVALGLTFPMLLLLGDFVYNATLYTSRRISSLIAVVVMCAAIVTGVVLGLLAPGWRQGILNFLTATSLLSLPMWWALTLRWYREAANAERLRVEQLAELAEREREAAVGAERSRLAADLHDVVAGHLSAIALQSEAALSLAGKDPATVSTVLRSVRENSVSALAEMREMIGLLRAREGERTAPPRLHDVDRLLDSARASGLRVEAEIAVNGAGNGQLPVTVDLAAYRILQEALTNAVRHAPGAAAAVRLAQDSGALVVDVRNSLTRPPPEGGHDGTGLQSMRARAEAVGGSLSAGEEHGEWHMRAVLPVAARDATGRDRRDGGRADTEGGRGDGN